jgi:hypothetical protein
MPSEDELDAAFETARGLVQSTWALDEEGYEPFVFCFISWTKRHGLVFELADDYPYNPHGHFIGGVQFNPLAGLLAIPSSFD